MSPVLADPPYPGIANLFYIHLLPFLFIFLLAVLRPDPGGDIFCFPFFAHHSPSNYYNIYRELKVGIRSDKSQRLNVPYQLRSPTILWFPIDLFDNLF